MTTTAAATTHCTATTYNNSSYKLRHFSRTYIIWQSCDNSQQHQKWPFWAVTYHQPIFHERTRTRCFTGHYLSGEKSYVSTTTWKTTASTKEIYKGKILFQTVWFMRVRASEIESEEEICWWKKLQFTVTAAKYQSRPQHKRSYTTTTTNAQSQTVATPSEMWPGERERDQRKGCGQNYSSLSLSLSLSLLLLFFFPAWSAKAPLLTQCCYRYRCRYLYPPSPPPLGGYIGNGEREQQQKMLLLLLLQCCNIFLLLLIGRRLLS